jgi:hypothetical protein
MAGLFSQYQSATATLAAIPGHAGGGVASGWSIVGEKGPELVNFGSPGRVYTADQTRAALGGAANDAILNKLDAILRENVALRAEIAAVRAEAVKTSGNTRRTADTIVRVTRDGESMVTVAA